MISNSQNHYKAFLSTDSRTLRFPHIFVWKPSQKKDLVATTIIIYTKPHKTVLLGSASFLLHQTTWGWPVFLFFRAVCLCLHHMNCIISKTIFLHIQIIQNTETETCKWSYFINTNSHSTETEGKKYLSPGWCHLDSLSKDQGH